MGHRIGLTPPPHRKHRSMQKIDTPGNVLIDNNNIAHLGIPCWYKNIRPATAIMRGPAYHNPTHGPRHVRYANGPVHGPQCGWLDTWHNQCGLYPNRPWNHHMCHKCRHLIDMSKLVPIHLLDDNEYGPNPTLIINFEKDTQGQQKIPGVTATMNIDPNKDDWVVRHTFTANCPSVKDKPETMRFTSYIKDDRINSKRIDTVFNGSITVMPTIL